MGADAVESLIKKGNVGQVVCEPDHDVQRRRLMQGMAIALLPEGLLAAEQPMARRPIPATGELLPVIGLGTWQTFDVSAAKDVALARETLTRFAALGGTVIDSSPMYGGAEALVGQLTEELAQRERTFLATKVWTQGRAEGIQQMQESMRRLKASRVDLMQIHNLLDAGAHIPSLREWKIRGRIRYWGITHYHQGAYGEVERLLRTARPDFLQINYSLAEPESSNRLLPLARDLGIAVIVNRPFAEGALFQRTKGLSIPGWAAELGIRSWAHYFLSWILSHPAVTCVIPATRNPDHVADNMGAGRLSLPSETVRTRMAAFLGA